MPYDGGMGHEQASRGQCARTLGREARHAASARGVARAALAPGMELTVHTRNSTYHIRPTRPGAYRVVGGWFDRVPGAGDEVEIIGCTWGGHAVCTELLAAPGLFLEFGNSVRTTRIRGVVLHPVLRGAETN